MTIHCIYEVPGQCPKVHDIKWSKNDQALKKNKKLNGRIHESQLTILSPTSDDKGKYKCTIVNAVGSVSKDVTLSNFFFRQDILKTFLLKRYPLILHSLHFNSNK